jgi:hypothetical protein
MDKSPLFINHSPAYAIPASSSNHPNVDESILPAGWYRHHAETHDGKGEQHESQPKILSMPLGIGWVHSASSVQRRAEAAVASNRFRG